MTRHGSESTPAIRLVVADVDGTLVTRDKVLTARALSSAHALRKAGVKLALTSGRPPRGLSMLVEPLAIDVPMAAFNGGMYVRPDLSPLETLAVAPPLVSSLIGILQHHGVDVWVYRGADWLVRRADAPHVALEQGTVRFPPTIVSGLDGCLDGVAKIVGVSDDGAALSRCLAEVHEHFPGRSRPPARNPTTSTSRIRTRTRPGRAVALPAPERAPRSGRRHRGHAQRRAHVQHGAAEHRHGHSEEAVRRSAAYVTTSSEEGGFARAMDRCILEGRVMR